MLCGEKSIVKSVFVRFHIFINFLIGQSLKILKDHKHYVQGVCWDPRGFYLATHSSDRFVCNKIC